MKGVCVCEGESEGCACEGESKGCMCEDEGEGCEDEGCVHVQGRVRVCV